MLRPFRWGIQLSSISRKGLRKFRPAARTPSSTEYGSESVDTMLKIALAYQRAIGQGTRTRLIGHERGYQRAFSWRNSQQSARFSATAGHRPSSSYPRPIEKQFFKGAAQARYQAGRRS
jgi:hypothetical protein